jgi:mycofactocin precursor
MTNQPLGETSSLESTVEHLDAAPTAEPTDDGLVEDELLVEEISIDGMCGVY